MERTGSSALSPGEGPVRLAQVGDNARVEIEGQGPLGQYFQGNCRRRGLKAPAQHGKMDGEIQLTEAAQRFLFAGTAAVPSRPCPGGRGPRGYISQGAHPLTRPFIAE